MSIKNLQEISSLVTNYTKKNRFVELVGGEVCAGVSTSVVWGWLGVPAEVADLTWGP